MPYLIALIILVVAGIAFAVMQSDPREPVAETTEVTSRNAEEEAPLEPEVNTTSGAAGATYQSEATYLTPARIEHTVGVNLTVADGIVTDATVTYNGGEPETPQQGNFEDAYRSEVIGQRLEDLELSRVGGASLTSRAFNDAVDNIIAEQA